MQYTSELVERIEVLRRQLNELEGQLRTEMYEFTSAKVAEGWQEFLFYSSYYGSHPEYGEGDLATTFLFHPSVDIGQWENVPFSHGTYSQNDENTAFDEWLKSLPEDHYVEIEMEVVG